MSKSIDEEKLSNTNQKDQIKVFSYLFLFFAGLILIVFLFRETQWVDTSRGWYLQPRITSLFGLGVFMFFVTVRVIQYNKRKIVELLLMPYIFPDLLERYRAAAVSSFVFLIFITSLSIIGFALSTFLFLVTLLWLSRLLNINWFFITLITVLVLVLIFRVGVNLWFPDVWLYELLPTKLSDFANQYL